MNGHGTQLRAMPIHLMLFCCRPKSIIMEDDAEVHEAIIDDELEMIEAIDG